MASEIPRLFQVRTAGGVGDVRANGVLWPDGSVTVYSNHPGHVAPEDASAFETLAEAGAHIEGFNGDTIVWLRQDTYADQPLAADQEV